MKSKRCKDMGRRSKINVKIALKQQPDMIFDRGKRVVECKDKGGPL
jgi:hypothetical protein